MTKKYGKKLNVLMLEFTKLPLYLQNVVRRIESFQNDCILELSSEFKPKDLTSIKKIKDCWKDQCKNKIYAKDFIDFISDYGLEFEIWIIDQKFDLNDVDKILIDICW